MEKVSFFGWLLKKYNPSMSNGGGHHQTKISYKIYCDMGPRAFKYEWRMELACLESS